MPHKPRKAWVGMGGMSHGAPAQRPGGMGGQGAPPYI